PLSRILTHWANHQYRTGADGLSYAELTARACISPSAADEPPNPDLNALFDLLGRAPLLTLLREGPWGCDAINRVLEQYLRPTWDRSRRGALVAGAPVLITR